MSKSSLFDILVVDDDGDLRELLKEFLEQKGLSVSTAANGKELKNQYISSKFRLIIMDIQMPGETGITLLKWLQKQTLPPPVLMLTANSTLDNKIEGLTLGAEDYMIKPFEPLELLTRIQVIFRREAPESKTSLLFSEFEFFFADLSLTFKGAPINLTSGEQELVELFCRHPNTILNRDFITQHIKGYEFDPFDRTIDIRITRLRKKLQSQTKQLPPLKTVRGKGYQLICEP